MKSLDEILSTDSKEVFPIWTEEEIAQWFDMIPEEHQETFIKAARQMAGTDYHRYFGCKITGLSDLVNIIDSRVQAEINEVRLDAFMATVGWINGSARASRDAAVKEAADLTIKHYKK